MTKTGYVLDARFLDHTNPPGHVERIDRVKVLQELMREYHREGLIRFDPREATESEIAAIHDAAYIRRVAATADSGYHSFDPDTFTCPKTYATARLAAGAALVLSDRIIAGEVRNGFALVRPPGHHAERDRAMGFCFFNNVAIVARYLQQHHGVERVLILDWDVHHGNGTQNSFYDDPTVYYISLHQYPFYPGTGAADETGIGRGKGFNLNIPLPAGCGNDEYLQAFHEIVLPAAKKFDPQFVLISAGFDAHRDDPLGGMEVDESGFAEMARMMLQIAGESAGGKCLALLEGGYDLGALKCSVAAVLDAFGKAVTQ